MNSRTWDSIGLVAGAVAAFFGLWGLVAPSDSFDEAQRFIAAGILLAGISGVCLALARRR